MLPASRPPSSLQGDVYVEPYSLQKDLSQRSNQLHSKPFVPVGGTKKPSGSGSLWGVFGRPGELLDTDASLGANSGRPRLTSADHKKNIYVSERWGGGSVLSGESGAAGGSWQGLAVDLPGDELYQS
jgi:hypothetical protein